jgi:hypothetical protein
MAFYAWQNVKQVPLAQVRDAGLEAHFACYWACDYSIGFLEECNPRK